MAYKSYRLGDVYRYLLEGDQESLQMARLLSMNTSTLGEHLSKLKKTNPAGYGAALVKLYAKPQSRQKLLDLYT